MEVEHIKPERRPRGRIAMLTAFAGVLIIASIMAYANYRLHYNGLLINDSHDYAQLAKNVFQGNGYATSVLRPIAYRFFQNLPQPEVTRMPGYPYLLSLLFRVTGAQDGSVAFFNGFWCVVLAGCVFLLAWELTRDPAVSFAASLLTASMQGFLSHSLQAEPNILYAALFTLFFWFYLKRREDYFLHGLCLGILQLVRANTQFVFLAFLLVTLLVASGGIKGKLLSVAKLVVGVMAGFSPQMVRNYLVTGTPFFSLYSYSLLMFTKTFPAYNIWTQLVDVNPFSYIMGNPGEIAAKSVRWLFLLIKESIEFYHPVVLLLIGLPLTLGTANPRVRHLRNMTILSMAIQLLLVLPFGAVPYYFLFFMPLLIVCSVSTIAEHAGKYRLPVFAGQLIIFLVVSVPFWKSSKPMNPFPAIGAEVAAITNADDVILTDIPWELAWYADRKSIWLPYDLATLEKIEGSLKVSYLVLTNAITRPYTPYKDFIWTQFFQEPDQAKIHGYEQIKVIGMKNSPMVRIYRKQKNMGTPIDE